MKNLKVSINRAGKKIATAVIPNAGTTDVALAITSNLLLQFKSRNKPKTLRYTLTTLLQEFNTLGLLEGSLEGASKKFKRFKELRKSNHPPFGIAWVSKDLETHNNIDGYTVTMDITTRTINFEVFDYLGPSKLDSISMNAQDIYCSNLNIPFKSWSDFANSIFKAEKYLKDTNYVIYKKI